MSAPADQVLGPGTVFDRYARLATLERVIDGDTLDLEVDLGFRLVARMRFRLAGIDAPEVRGPTATAGWDATDWLARQLNGRRLAVVSFKTEKYGRWLAQVYVEQPDKTWRHVNPWMIQVGHARPYGT